MTETRVALMVLLILPGPLLAADLERREQKQERRIERGEESGRLSDQEGERLERQDRAIDQEEDAMRQLDGGKLDHGDRRQLQRERNQLSRHIRRQKHDNNGR